MRLSMASSAATWKRWSAAIANRSIRPHRTDSRLIVAIAAEPASTPSKHSAAYKAGKPSVTRQSRPAPDREFDPRGTFLLDGALPESAEPMGICPVFSPAARDRVFPGVGC